jgi:hypothetical protein
MGVGWVKIEKTSLGDSNAHYRPWNSTQGMGGASKIEPVIGYRSISSHIRPAMNDILISFEYWIM